jgi:predicted XRE-type DNA-binding protein
VTQHSQAAAALSATPLNEISDVSVRFSSAEFQSHNIQVDVEQSDGNTCGNEMKTNSNDNRKKLLRINEMIQNLCGLYSRVAERVGVTRSYVSRVARGERRSEEIEQTLIREFEDIT